MRNFGELASEWSLQRTASFRTGTLYQLRTPQGLQSPFDWGMSNVFHFDRELSAAIWISLRERVQHLLQADEALRDLITFVPYTEVGADFVVQCKPPYDGGYFLSSLNEWLEHGDCCNPPDACEAANARLQTELQRVIGGLPASDREGRGHVMRRTVTEDAASQMQFVEDGSWRVYELQLADEYIGHLLGMKWSRN